jgi:hypothetical protein
VTKRLFGKSSLVLAFYDRVAKEVKGGFADHRRKTYDSVPPPSGIGSSRHIAPPYDLGR